MDTDSHELIMTPKEGRKEGRKTPCFSRRLFHVETLRSTGITPLYHYYDLIRLFGPSES